MYINCITATEHLQVRSGGSVFLENACISKMIKIGSYLPSDDTDAAPAWVLNKAKEYLENDMVSLTFLHISMNYSENDRFIHMGVQLK